MIHIAITAGGTEEPIDGVRKITNMSSGSLGWYCLEAVLNLMRELNRTDFRIHYIKAPSAITKNLQKEEASFVNFVDVTNTQSVYESVETLLSEQKINIFIHAMAISDFTYSYSASIADLAEELYSAFAHKPHISKEEIAEIITNPQSKHVGESKISSQKEIVMGLKTTPKVISLIKKMSKNTFLVGFKLIKTENGEAREKKMVEEAEKLRITNQCDAVFANDASDLSVTNHSGILLHNGEIIARPIGKKNIAESIVSLAMREFLNYN